jgi:hypothetical protein
MNLKFVIQFVRARILGEFRRFLFTLALCLLGMAVSEAATVNVNQQSELDMALKVAESGDVIQLIGNEPYVISIRNRSYSPPLTIRNRDPGSPTVIRLANVIESDGIIFSDLKMNSRIPHEGDRRLAVFSIIKSKNIRVTNSVLSGSAVTYLSELDKQGMAENFILIRWSDNIEISKNDISGFMHGISILESRYLEISNNNISRLQGDGIRMGGVQWLTISDNRISDFLGADQSVTHSDMIQLWSTNSKLVSNNIKIQRNRLLSGNGPATQAIFMRNEQSDKNTTNEDRFYSDITVEDNLIHNGHLHGIMVGETRRLLVKNNTLIPNFKSTMGIGSKRRNFTPMIRISKRATDTIISNNITGGIISAPPSVNLVNNFILPREKFLMVETLEKTFNSSIFEGTLTDKQYLVKPEADIWNNRIGSTLTYGD